MDNRIEEKLEYLESLFVKYGAVSTDMKYGESEDGQKRCVYSFKGSFCCVGTLKFPESDDVYLVISCAEDEKFAKVGILDNVDAFGADVTEEEMDEKVRTAFGIESL